MRKSKHCSRAKAHYYSFHLLCRWLKPIGNGFLITKKTYLITKKITNQS